MQFITKSREDNDMTDRTSVIFITELWRPIRKFVVVMRMRQEIDMNDHIVSLYSKKEIELSWLIW